MFFFRHYANYKKYVKINVTILFCKIAALLLGIVLYQLVLCMNILPKLNDMFPNNVVQIILFTVIGLILVFSCVFIVFKSKEILNSRMICFLKNLGFTQKDIVLFITYKTFYLAFVSGAFVTATCIGELCLSSLTRYVYQPILFAIAMLIISIPISFMPSQQRKAVKNRKASLANKIFFRNKYLANLYKDLLMLVSKSDFIAYLLIELFLFVIYFIFIPYNKQIYNIFLYLLIWFASLTTQSVFLVDVPYSMAMNSLIYSKKDLYKIKLFEITLLCELPALLFFLANIGLGNINIVDCIFSILTIVLMSYFLTSGSIVIACMYFPNINGSTIFMILYYLLGIFPPLIIIVSSAMSVKFWRSKECSK